MPPRLSRYRCLGRPGYSLIEMLVTVSLIVLLIALLLPAIAKARTVAFTTVCLSNQRSIFLASRLFAADHRNYYPITTSGYSGFYGGSDPVSNPMGYYHSGRHLDKGGYFQMDDGVRAGLVNPVARCPERRANYATTFGVPEYRSTGSPGTMDFITSNLTGTPRFQTTMQAWDPWSSPFDNTFWFSPRNPYPASTTELGRYGPYLADDIPPRKILLADAPLNLRISTTSYYPITTSLSGVWFDVPGGMTMLTTGGAGPTVIEDNMSFPLHSGGFNGVFFDGSGKTISGLVAMPTTLVLGSAAPAPNYALWNLFRWTPKGPTSLGNAGYAPPEAYPDGFPADSGF